MDEYSKTPNSKASPTVRVARMRQKLHHSDGGVLYNDLRPLFVVLRLYGIFPISQDARTGALVFHWWSPWVLLALVLWLLEAMVAALSADDQLALLAEEAAGGRPLYESAFTALGAILLAYVPFLPGTAWAEAPNLCAVLNHWRLIQADYEALAGRPLRLGLRRRCWLFVGALLFVTQPMLWATSAVLRGYPLWRMLPYMQFNAYFIGLAALWDHVCMGVERTCAALADTVAALPQRRDTLRAHRLLWLRVSAVLPLVGNGLSASKRLFLAFIFVEWVETAFTVMSVVLGGFDLRHAFIPACIATQVGASLYTSCDAAQRALDAVRCRSRDELLRLKTADLENDAVEEVLLLLNAIHSTTSEFISLDGFYEINRSTLVKYFKTTGTYLVILCQFALSMSKQY